ncbi:hypothetical protein H0B56_05955 [Haloechinothrix sp. YIM 98757]|uniref:Uncharacterized protein n=1 Tax=Haloechinothrix aidingensis TaxID=2752311 RepID=A0A838A962_9PSEU|nr:hypothetical protein [Haloechinothrix aidingensis]MBA0125082.1 hypothetical protein [Haloechinothrix aidingensis]
MFWIWFALIATLPPLLTLPPWGRLQGWLIPRGWQRDPHDMRPRVVATRDGYELDRGGL